MVVLKASMVLENVPDMVNVDSLTLQFPSDTVMPPGKARVEKSSNVLTLTWPETSAANLRPTTWSYPRKMFLGYRICLIL